MKQIRLNAFIMNSVTQSHQGMWRHPRDRSRDYLDLDYWIAFAQVLERGKFDGVFLADGLGVYDTFGGNADAALRSAVMIPRNDPAMLVPAMAAATRHLGFGVTFGVLDEMPYAFARRISTLDHLTRGRIGWNIVTGFLDSAAKARGVDQQLAHDDRYDAADEFMEVVYRLWEESWEDGAVLSDAADGIYADPTKIHRIRHEGPHFRLDAIHMSEPSPQRTPVLYQAGTSARGIEFAARHAECVFTNGRAPLVAARVRKIREAAVRHGRAPDDIQVLASMNIIVAATDDEAAEKHREYSQYIDHRGTLVRLSGQTGIDLAQLRLDAAIEATSGASSNAIHAMLENLTKGNPDRRWTVGDVADSLNPDGPLPVLVGSAPRVADLLQQWVEESGVDGFNLLNIVRPGSMTDVVDLLVPELQRRGVYKTEYAPGTLREKLFGAAPKTPGTHPSGRFRAI